MRAATSPADTIDALVRAAHRAVAGPGVLVLTDAVAGAWRALRLPPDEVVAALERDGMPHERARRVRRSAGPAHCFAVVAARGVGTRLLRVALYGAN